ncbi:transposase [Magnetospirillum gryphiswaldense MSR-1 v2]|uniref:Transposase n=1 Tax=Magnetospirillum gryphiswaldense (strain DSM 6361 / JCM 21280 / NBRC 15271 / MSR-1) TaxID=431944 RepID=V6F6H2_MAGGM|nr:transposase [Magnetospirillum gryphiswaldense]CDL00967.1 transposase [Magnetospirillum gryphiswaldense MSR-1 v2]
MGQVHILSGPERRRRWSEGERRAIVAAAFAPGAVVREVARQADVCPSLIYRWRRQEGIAAPEFAPVVVMADEVVAAAHPVSASMAVMEVEFANMRIRIPASTPPELAAAVVKALGR